MHTALTMPTLLTTDYRLPTTDYRLYLLYLQDEEAMKFGVADKCMQLVGMVPQATR